MRTKIKLDEEKFANSISLIVGSILIGIYMQSGLVGCGLYFVLFPFINNFRK